MRILLSNHAIMRAKQRNITFEEITDCILKPDKLQVQENNTTCYKKLLASEQKDRQEYIPLTQNRSGGPRSF